MSNYNSDSSHDYGDVSGVINACKDYLYKTGLSRNTKKNYLRISYLLMSYVANRGRLSLGDLSCENISGFITIYHNGNTRKYVRSAHSAPVFFLFCQRI